MTPFLRRSQALLHAMRRARLAVHIILCGRRSCHWHFATEDDIGGKQCAATVRPSKRPSTQGDGFPLGFHACRSRF